MILFINACTGNKSRTEQIARAYLKRYPCFTEVCLDSTYMEPLDSVVQESRDKYISQNSFTHSYFDSAKTFAEADEIVIAAPFWDLSFPAKLRIYLENICINGITFSYSNSNNEIPIGMCKAKKLVYITTSGGPYIPDFSYNYIKHLAADFWGIKETELIYAENLDIQGNDPQQIVSECIANYCA